MLCFIKLVLIISQNSSVSCEATKLATFGHVDKAEVMLLLIYLFLNRICNFKQIWMWITLDTVQLCLSRARRKLDFKPLTNILTHV